MTFWKTLWSAPPATPLSRYIAWNGALYLAMGLATWGIPHLPELALQLPPATPTEQGLWRAIGVPLAVIGWLYVMGARTRAESFCLATVVDRAFIPLLMLPLGFWGLLPMRAAVAFSVLDPALALGAYII